MTRVNFFMAREPRQSCPARPQLLELLAARRWMLPSMLVLLSGLLAPPAAHAYTSGQWLYVVEVAVAAQSAQARQRAAGRGLLQVLTRVTGLLSVPRSSEVNAAVANPGRYYNEFVFYTETDGSGREQPHLRIVFQRDAVLRLARAARLPIWWNRRPQVMLWVVVEQQGRRQILDTNSRGPLVEALRMQALRRGLPVILPLMDLQDRLAVSAADIWGRLTGTLAQAAARYAADLVLVGRVKAVATAAGELQYQGDWDVWQQGSLQQGSWQQSSLQQGQPLVGSAQQASAQQMAVAGVDVLADSLAARFAVLPRGLQRQQFAIAGLQDIAGYADLLAYLSSLEFLDEVNVAGLDRQTLSLLVDSHAQVGQLTMLLTAEGRLVRDEAYRGVGTGLVWQG